MAKKVLVIDDEKNLRMLLTLLLEAHGYEVATAEDGEVGIEKINQYLPNLVISDLFMPKKSGREVLSHILYLRANLSKIKIIMMSGGDRNGRLSEDGKDLLSLGCDTFIAKPFSCATIISEIRELLGE